MKAATPDGYHGNRGVDDGLEAEFELRKFLHQLALFWKLGGSPSVMRALQPLVNRLKGRVTHRQIVVFGLLWLGGVEDGSCELLNVAIEVRANGSLEQLLCALRWVRIDCVAVFNLTLRPYAPEALPWQYPAS